MNIRLTFQKEKENEYRSNLEGERAVAQLTEEQRNAFIAKIEEAGIKEMAIEKSGNAELAEKFFAAVDAVTSGATTEADAAADTAADTAE